MATISNYNKHLTLSERIKIEQALDKETSFRKISNDIKKGVNTISREIENRRYKEKGNYFNGIPKKCERTEKAPFVCNGSILKNVVVINFIIVQREHKTIMKKF